MCRGVAPATRVRDRGRVRPVHPLGVAWVLFVLAGVAAVGSQHLSVACPSFPFATTLLARSSSSHPPYCGLSLRARADAHRNLPTHKVEAIVTTRVTQWGVPARER